IYRPARDVTAAKGRWGVDDLGSVNKTHGENYRSRSLPPAPGLYLRYPPPPTHRSIGGNNDGGGVDGGNHHGRRTDDVGTSKNYRCGSLPPTCSPTSSVRARCGRRSARSP